MNILSTSSHLSLAFSFHQVMLAFTLNQVVLIRRQGLVLDHGEAEDEEEDAPDLHSVSVRLFKWKMICPVEL